MKNRGVRRPDSMSKPDVGPGRHMTQRVTTMIKHTDSHLDHGISETQLAYILQRFADRRAFFIETFELPTELGTIMCGLYGPTMGDPPVVDEPGVVVAKQRGVRQWASRMIDAPLRPTRIVTVVAGPHEEECSSCSPRDHFADDGHRLPVCVHCNDTRKVALDCVLFTAYGGPAAPQEPGDPKCRNPEASWKFWSEHALADRCTHNLRRRILKTGDLVIDTHADKRIHGRVDSIADDIVTVVWGSDVMVTTQCACTLELA